MKKIIMLSVAVILSFVAIADKKTDTTNTELITEKALSETERIIDKYTRRLMQ